MSLLRCLALQALGKKRAILFPNPTGKNPDIFEKPKGSCQTVKSSSSSGQPLIFLTGDLHLLT
jgi:hypothetical protein